MVGLGNVPNTRHNATSLHVRPDPLCGNTRAFFLGRCICDPPIVVLHPGGCGEMGLRARVQQHCAEVLRPQLPARSHSKRHRRVAGHGEDLPRNPTRQARRHTPGLKPHAGEAPSEERRRAVSGKTQVKRVQRRACCGSGLTHAARRFHATQRGRVRCTQQELGRKLWGDWAERFDPWARARRRSGSRPCDGSSLQHRPG